MKNIEKQNPSQMFLFLLTFLLYGLLVVAIGEDPNCLINFMNFMNFQISELSLRT
jgi:hypothetical protein